MCLYFSSSAGGLIAKYLCHFLLWGRTKHTINLQREYYDSHLMLFCLCCFYSDTVLTALFLVNTTASRCLNTLHALCIIFPEWQGSNVIRYIFSFWQGAPWYLVNDCWYPISFTLAWQLPCCPRLLMRIVLWLWQSLSEDVIYDIYSSLS